MIYLDIVSIHTPAERLIRRGGMMIRETFQEIKRYIRFRDDRSPGEEMLLPLENIEDLAHDMSAPTETEPHQLGHQLLLEPF